MLAAKVRDLKSLKYPLIGQQKLDGIRVFVNEFGIPVSRTGKKIPNSYICSQISRYPFHDGEIIIPGKSFNETSGFVRSINAIGHFRFVAFDRMDEPSWHYIRRYDKIRTQYKIDNHYLRNSDEAIQLFNDLLAEGAEGLILRSPKGRYKFGRSTVREQYLLKIKPEAEEEAEILNVVIREKDIALVVLSNKYGSFSIGSGFTAAQKAEFLRERQGLIGKRVRFKFQKEGMKNKPRFPIFKEVIREEELENRRSIHP